MQHPLAADKGHAHDTTILHFQRVPQTGDDHRQRDSLEIEPLAARQDRYRHLMRFCGGKDELNVGRRFFKGFQKGIEGIGRQHVNFVDDEDLEAAPRWKVFDVVTELPDVVDAGVGSAVDLEHIDGITCSYLATGGAGITWLGGRSIIAIQGLGKNAGRTGLADATGSGEKEGMGNPAAIDGILQGLTDVFLADQVTKRLGPPFSGEYKIRHETSTSLVIRAKGQKIVTPMHRAVVPRFFARRYRSSGPRDVFICLFLISGCAGGTMGAGFKRTQLIAGHPRGTRSRLLPLLPSGPDGVHNLPLRRTQLSVVSANRDSGMGSP